MHLRTLILLALVVGGLVAAVAWQTKREEAEYFAPPEALFEGVVSHRVDRIRIDNLERSVQMLIELREGEGWVIVDPFDAPAEGALVQLLLEAAEGQDARPVEETDLARLGLDPPRAVIEFTERIGGEPLVRRLELGAGDLDRQYSVVRVDGRVARTLRTFESLLDRPADEWRTRQIVRGFDPFSVVELHRRGSIAFQDGDEPLELELDVVNEDGWWATSPVRARLDPGALGLVLQTAGALRASDFVDDAPLALDVYGLDEPQFELELTSASGRVETLKLAPYGAEEWAVLASSDPRVYAVSLDTVLALTTPFDLLVERSLLRAVRERVERISLQNPERTLVLEQRPPGWLLRSGSIEREADPQRVGDLLSELERARVLALLPEQEFVPAPGGPLSIRVEHAGRVDGGELGADHTLADGGSGVLFRRHGDALVTLVDPAVADLARSTLADFENRQLVLVPELELARIELEREGRELVYVRNELGRWSRKGTEVEARGFAILVDRLLSIRKADGVDVEDGSAGGPSIAVRVHSRTGAVVSYGVEPGAGGDLLLLGERREPIPGGLHADLNALFERTE